MPEPPILVLTSDVKIKMVDDVDSVRSTVHTKIQIRSFIDE